MPELRFIKTKLELQIHSCNYYNLEATKQM